MDLKRIADEGNIWVCGACGKWREGDLYTFSDESCVLNAVEVKREDCKFTDGGGRVIAVAPFVVEQ